MTNETALTARRTGWWARLFLFSQICALLAAGYLGWHSYRMVDDDRFDIDRALLWMAGALVLVAYFAWDGKRPRVLHAPRSVVAYVRAHPAELAVLGAIIGAGVFIRLFWFGKLPPNGYLFFEEHINGGIGWDVLHGDRPYGYPLERYSSALGQWLIGPSTVGLRAPMVAAGILVLVPFYLMMREAVDRPAALFATAIFASLKGIADTSAYFQMGELVSITMIWMFLRGLRTANTLWFVPVAACAALVLYEYETLKAVPFFGAPFAVVYWLRQSMWPVPRSGSALWQGTRTLVRRAAKPVIVTTAVVLIGIGPMIAEAHRGHHIFFSSLERQKGDRSAQLLSPDAAEQLKWSAQILTPWLKPEYPAIGPVPARGVIDKITSVLVWASVAAACAMFWRGGRALFLAWFVGGVLAASLLLSQYSAWKIAGFLPPAVALTGFFADDAIRLARRLGGRAVWLVMAALVGVAGSVFVVNGRALDANAHDPRVVIAWSNNPSQLFSICDHLRGRPSDNFAYVSQRVRPGWGFSRPPKDFRERVEAWNDWVFVCWGLQGQSIANLQEAWPLYRATDGPVNLVTVIGSDEMPDTMDAVARAIPGLGPPDRSTTSPGGMFHTLSFAVTGSQLNERRGLLLRAVSRDGTASEASIVPGPSFVLPHRAGDDAFTLTGIVYAASAIDASLVADAGPGAPPVTITVDGAVSYDSITAPGAETPRRMLRGWHVVQVRGFLPADATLRMRWHGRDGTSVALGEDDFYAVEDLSFWRHTRTYQGATVGEAVRFDFHPHLTNYDGIRIDSRNVLPAGTKVSEDRWSARWTVETAGAYTIAVAAPAQTVTMTIDGKTVLTSEGTVSVPLAAGDHAVELVFSNDRPLSTGGLLTVKDSAGQPVSMIVHPF